MAGSGGVLAGAALAEPMAGSASASAKAREVAGLACSLGGSKAALSISKTREFTSASGSLAADSSKERGSLDPPSEI